MASYFWVGGSGPWNSVSTANWSLSSGGAAGAGPPNSGDTLTFDSLSGSGTCTTDATAAAGNIVLNSATLTLAMGANFSVTAQFSLTAGTLDLGGFILTCRNVQATSASTRAIAFGTTGKIRMNGNALGCWLCPVAGAFSFTGSGNLELTYAGATGTRSYQHGNTSGATEANSPHLSVVSGTDIVTVIVGVGNLDFTGFAGTLTNDAKTVYGNLTYSTGMTITAGALATTLATTSSKTITTNGKTLDFPLIFNGVGGTWTFAGSLTQGATRGFTMTNGTVALKASATSAVGVFGTSGSSAKTLQSSSAGLPATISQASGTVNVSFLSIKDSLATGGATFSALISNSNVNLGGNLGWNFGTPSSGAGKALTMGLGITL